MHLKSRTSKYQNKSLGQAPASITRPLDYAAYIVDEKKTNDTTVKRDQLPSSEKAAHTYIPYYGPIDLKSVGLFAEKM